MPVVYKTIDKTDPNAKDKGTQQARVEERRYLSLQKAEEEKRQHAAHISKMQTELNELKAKFQNYKFGEAIHPKTFEKLDVRDMKYVRIAVFGPFGGGKTSLISTIERALFEEGHLATAVPQGFGTDGTLIMEEYLNELSFHLVDTRGLFDVEKEEQQEIQTILDGKIQPGEAIKREGDAGYAAVRERTDIAFHQKIHAVIFVFKSTDQRFLQGSYDQQIQCINKHFNFEGYTPITVITGGDIEGIDQDEEKIKEIRTKASQTTGSPTDYTFILTNYTTKEQDPSLQWDHKAMQIIYRAVMAAEKYVQIQKLRESYKTKDNGETSMADFLSTLQEKHGWEVGRVKSVQEALENQGIGSADDLKQYWESIKKDIPCSMGMKKVISMELKDLKA